MSLLDVSYLEHSIIQSLFMKLFFFLLSSLYYFRGVSPWLRLCSEFKLQLHNYTHFLTNTLQKGINPLILLPSYELNNTTTVLLQWMSLALNNP